MLTANGLSGSRATSFLVAHFAMQNTASNPAEKNRALPEKQKGKVNCKARESALGQKKIEKISVLFRRSPATECGINSAEAGGNVPIELPISSERRISFRTTTRSVRGQSSRSASGFSLKKARIWLPG